MESPVNITLKDGMISNITVSDTGMGTEVIIDGATVTNLNIFAKTEVIVNSGSVDRITTGRFAEKSTITVAEGAKVQTVNAQTEITITGKGNVAGVVANVNNVRVDTIGTIVTVSKGAYGVIAGGKPVESGSTITTALNDSSIDKDVESDSSIDDKSNKDNNSNTDGSTPRSSTPGGGATGGGGPSGGGSTPGGNAPGGGGTPGGGNGGGNGGNNRDSEWSCCSGRMI